MGAKPLVATLGLSVDEAERHAITGPPDGRLARAIAMSYTYPEHEQGEAEADEEGIIHSGFAVPLPGETQTLGYLTVFTRSKTHEFRDDDVRQLEALALRAGPAIESARRFREARQLADLDALTGLHNRRYFHARRSPASARAPTATSGGSRWSSSTSTTSRRSTTGSGTWPGMPRWPRPPSACATSSARRTSHAVSAATSSR
jgi:hypothetical protein